MNLIAGWRQQALHLWSVSGWPSETAAAICIGCDYVSSSPLFSSSRVSLHVLFFARLRAVGRC